MFDMHDEYDLEKSRQFRHATRFQIPVAHLERQGYGIGYFLMRYRCIES